MKAYTESTTPTEDKDEQATPRWFYRRVQQIMGMAFDVDVCASEGNHKALVYWTKEDNCLEKTWWGDYDKHYFWMNPPYSMLSEFTATAFERSQQEGIIIVGLVPHMPSSKWFQEYIHNKCPTVWMPDGRISFELYGKARASNPLPSCLPVWTPWRSDTSYVYFPRNKPASCTPTRTRVRRHASEDRTAG